MTHRSARKGLGFLVFGRGVSSVGTQVTFLCLPAAVVAVPGSSNALVAAFEGMTVLGFVLFAIPAGVIADRMRPHSVLMTCDLGRALCMLAAGGGFLHASHSPALLPLAGLLVATSGAAFGLFLHAGTFVAGALALVFGRRWLRAVSAPPLEKPTGAQVDKAVRSGGRYALEGFRILRSQRMPAASTASVAMANLFSGVYGAAYVVFVLRELELGGQGLALLGVTMAAGALAGAALTGKAVRLRGPIAVLTLAPSGYGLLMMVAAAPAGNLWLPAIAVFGYAFVSAMASIAYVTFRQEAAPQSAAGRVAAASRAITGGVFSLSAVGAVLLLTLMPVRTVICISVLGETASVFILLVAGGLAHVRRTPTPDRPAVDRTSRHPRS